LADGNDKVVLLTWVAGEELLVDWLHQDVIGSVLGVGLYGGHQPPE